MDENVGAATTSISLWSAADKDMMYVMAHKKSCPDQAKDYVHKTCICMVSMVHHNVSQVTEPVSMIMNIMVCFFFMLTGSEWLGFRSAPVSNPVQTKLVLLLINLNAVSSTFGKLGI